ncbi:MAG: hypothetical protein LBB60_07930 [Desulfovibrio sp.]|jgi:hypothetical protein|nr:hypothetical protein [Desulfovibrio sp.]
MNINIPEYLSLFDNYAVLKKTDVFPAIPLGGDIDVLVEDRAYAEKLLVEHFLRSDAGTYTLSAEQRDYHTHIDLLREGKILIRFDLIDSFDFLRKIHVKHSFATHVLTNKVGETVEGKTLFFPSPLDDMLIRYLEYIEYFETIPTKQKHLDYVLAHGEATPWPYFISHVHRFTKLAHDEYVENPHKYSVSGKGLRQLLDPVIRRLPSNVKSPLKKIYLAMRSAFPKA